MTNVNFNINVPNLSVLLEGLVLDEDYVMSLDLKQAKALWEAYRIANGMTGRPPLLTYPENQLKLNKSEAYSVGLTLQSADSAGVETCPWRGQCAEVCVLKNGNGRYNHVQTARSVKTRFLRRHPQAFMRLLVDELDRVVEKEQVVANGLRGLPLRCRMNVNSDLRWYRIAPWLFERYEGSILFYDYTKNPAILRVPKGLVEPNYLLVYSLNETSPTNGKVEDFLLSGGKVAAVTNRKRHAPVKQWLHEMYPVVDGDKTDDLWSHPEGSIIDLTAKGSARKLGEGFVRHVYN